MTPLETTVEGLVARRSGSVVVESNDLVVALLEVRLGDGLPQVVGHCEGRKKKRRGEVSRFEEGGEGARGSRIKES
jgi:hypothetical protein